MLLFLRPNRSTYETIRRNIVAGVFLYVFYAINLYVMLMVVRVRLAMMKSLAYWGKYKLVYVDVKNTFCSLEKRQRHQKNKIYKPCTNALFLRFLHVLSLLGLESYTSMNCIDFVEMFMIVKI